MSEVELRLYKVTDEEYATPEKTLEGSSFAGVAEYYLSSLSCIWQDNENAVVFVTDVHSGESKRLVFGVSVDIDFDVFAPCDAITPTEKSTWTVLWEDNDAEDEVEALTPYQAVEDFLKDRMYDYESWIEGDDLCFLVWKEDSLEKEEVNATVKVTIDFTLIKEEEL